MQVENQAVKPSSSLKLWRFAATGAPMRGADLAGSSRLAYPADVKDNPRALLLPCEPAVHPSGL